MKETLTTDQAAYILTSDDNANWSYKGAQALVEWFEQLEEETETEIEMDRVAIRCDFSEYESLEDWASEYFGDESWKHTEIDVPEGADDDEIDQLIRDYITDMGQLIEFDGGIIVSSF